MSINRQHILFRVDANHHMGMGHAMRCFALAEELISRGHDVTYATSGLPEALEKRLKTAGVSVLHQSGSEDSAAHFANLVRGKGAGRAVIDGYHLSDDYEVALSALAGVASLRFDDYLSGQQSHANFVLNASANANHDKYRAWAPKAKLLLGPAYTLFRKEMLAAETTHTESNAASSKTVFVSFGGSDPLHLTARIAAKLAETLPDATIEAVTGIAHSNPTSVAALHFPNVRHHHNPSDLPAIMSRARFAISAGGGTIHELGLLKIPTLLVVTAPNQAPNASSSWCETIIPDRELTASSNADVIDKISHAAEILWHDGHARKEILKRIPATLDTLGAKRVADALLEGHSDD